MTPAPRATPTQQTTLDAAPTTRVLRQFRVVFNAVKTHFRQVEREAGVGGAQLWALSVIRSNPGIGMNDLAHAMDVHQSTASNLVKSLVTREMIVAAKNGTDRRAVTLHLLPTGEKVLHKAPAPFTGVLPDALASLDARTLARLDRDLGKLIVALEADENSAKFPLANLYTPASARVNAIYPALRSGPVSSTITFSFGLAWKVTTRRALMGIFSPVFGLRPGRCGLSRNWKLPKLDSLTASPRSRALRISLKKVSTMSFASRLFRPIWSNNNSASSALVKVGKSFSDSCRAVAILMMTDAKFAELEAGPPIVCHRSRATHVYRSSVVAL